MVLPYENAFLTPKSTPPQTPQKLSVAHRDIAAVFFQFGMPLSIVISLLHP